MNVCAGENIVGGDDKTAVTLDQDPQHRSTHRIRGREITTIVPLVRWGDDAGQNTCLKVPGDNPLRTVTITR